MPMSDAAFDDPAGRTRFAWARTLMVTFIASLVVERLLFADRPWSAVVLIVPVAVMGVLTLLRSRPLRRDPQGFTVVFPAMVLACVLAIASIAVFGVAML